MLSHQG